MQYFIKLPADIDEKELDLVISLAYKYSIEGFIATGPTMDRSELHQTKTNNAVLSLLVAGWLHYVIDAVEKSQSVADPMNDQLQALIKEQQDAWQQALALLHLSAIFGDLSNHQPFINEIKIAFANIKNKGIKATISQLLSDEQK